MCVDAVNNHDSSQPSFNAHQDTAGRSVDMSGQIGRNTTAKTIAPPPLEMSTAALYTSSTTAFVCAGLALVLGVSYIACALPIPVSHGKSEDVMQLTMQMGIAEYTCSDEHYKYLWPLLIPTTAWFVIANWVGWEYFRNA
jgi:hypothetical protein